MSAAMCALPRRSLAFCESHAVSVVEAHMTLAELADALAHMTIG